MIRLLKPKKKMLVSRLFSGEVFDRDLKMRQRQFSYDLPGGEYYDYIRSEAAERLLDRLDDITRNFPLALEIGGYRNHVLNGIQAKENFRGSGGGLGGIENLVICDHISRENQSSLLVDKERQSSPVQSHSVLCDEEYLPFKEKTFDLVLSNLTLHWVNDLPSTFKQIKEVLKPDGAFIGNMFVGDTLRELRHCFYLAEQERRGGFSPHTSPLAKASDVAYLMQNAGFSLPAVDVDTITVKLLELDSQLLTDTHLPDNLPRCILTDGASGSHGRRISVVEAPICCG